MSVQLILKEGKPEYAVVPYDVYVRLIEDAEILEDIRDYDAAIQGIERGDELIPYEVVQSLLSGANPIRVWREYRDLAQHDLAAAAGISPAYLSQLESGKRSGTTEVLSAISRVLRVDIDDLVV